MKPLIIGHRGASAFAPENTMAAFRLALEVGADGIEFDVRLSRDGVPVVIHDENLKRTGSTPVLVSSLSLAELKKIDVGSWFDRTNKSTQRSYVNETIPTLEEVFELFEGTSARLYLEMKSEPCQIDRLADVCCSTLRHSSLKHQVVVECFDHAGIKTIKKLDKDIKTAALFEPTLKSPPRITSSTRLIEKAQAVSADEIALHHSLANPRTIKAARDADLNVAVWTVDSPKWISLAVTNKISVLITNNPETMLRVRDGLGV